MMQVKRTEQEFVPNKETLKEAHSEEDIREIIRTIELYLQQTREVLDRIEKDIEEMKKEDRINREKDETVHPGKDPAQEAGMSL